MDTSNVANYRGFYLKFSGSSSCSSQYSSFAYIVLFHITSAKSGGGMQQVYMQCSPRCHHTISGSVMWFNAWMQLCVNFIPLWEWTWCHSTSQYARQHYTHYYAVTIFPFYKWDRVYLMCFSSATLLYSKYLLPCLTDPPFGPCERAPSFAVVSDKY